MHACIRTYIHAFTLHQSHAADRRAPCNINPEALNPEPQTLNPKR